MLFRALMTDYSAMKDFMNVVTCLSKFSKECIMRVTSRKLYFITSDEDSGPRKPLTWCELPVHYYFREYKVSGFSEEYNEIYLEFSVVLLARSLSILKQNAKSVKIKLTNKDTPCLTIEMILSSGEIQSRQCLYDIPVGIISKRHWSDYEEPRCNNFHVSIEMPNLKVVKNIIDKMKNMSHCLKVSADKNGRLTLQVKTSVITLSSHFPELPVESFAVGQFPTLNNTDLDDGNEPLNTVHSTVDIKKFLMYLSGMQLNHCKTTCSIVHEKMVKLSMEQAGVLSLQIFLIQLTI